MIDFITVAFTTTGITDQVRHELAQYLNDIKSE